MKIITFLFLISISLTLSKRKKHHDHSASKSSELEYGYLSSIEDSESGEYKEKDKFFEGYKISESFNFNGNLRQIFAVVTAVEDPKSNVVCSPVSALLPLGKLALGAKGKSHQELLETVGESSIKKLSKSFMRLIDHLRYIPGVELNLASRIYVSDKAIIKKKFAQDSKNVFRSGIEKVSFGNPKQAADEINGWVARQTKGMIPMLIDPNQISSKISLVLVNAIYFRGKWKKPFANVHVGNFQSPTGIKKVQLMTQKSRYDYTDSKILNAKVIKIPYQKSKASFVIVLPNEVNGLPLLLKQLKLAPNLLNQALESLLPTHVFLTIPKFKITTSLDLKDIFKKIGVTHIFRPNSGLTEMVENQELWVSSAIQKSVIEVHERGTEAAAASGKDIILNVFLPEDKKTD